MDNLIKKSLDYLAATAEAFVRPFSSRIDWSDRIIGIRGGRGVGKSTLIRQHLKETHDTKSAIYLSLDDPYFSDNSLEQVIDLLRVNGYQYFYLDEVHRLPGWAPVIKSYHDRFHGLRFVFSGSSLIDMHQIGTDLSRRAVMYEMPGLSFREYLILKEIADIPAIQIQDILSEHANLSRSVAQEFTPLVHFHQYLKAGYYPYFLEGGKTYYIRLIQSLRTVLESDMAAIEGFDMSKSQLLLKLLYIVAGSVPYKPNISLLARRTGLHANTVVKYLHYLERAGILSFLWSPNKGMSLLQKPDKVYLENSNIAYALRGDDVEIGSIRELFFHNQVGKVAQLQYTSKADFIVDDTYLFEVGGPGKEVKLSKNVFIVKDCIDHGAGNVIPLWLFGMLY